jgi:hypothetical protein
MHDSPEPRDRDSRLPGARDGSPRLAVWALTGLGLLLRLAGLGTQDLWFDEVNTLWRVSAGSLRAVVTRIAGDVQAPLYDLLAWAFTAGGSLTGATWVRLPSALLSAALVPVTAALARELGLRRRGQAIAAALVALAPFQVRFAQEARPYALLALLSGLLLLAAARVAASGGRRGLLLLAVTGPLLALVHYYGVLAWLAVAAALLLDAAACAGRLPRLLYALLPTVAGLLLWSPAALRQFRLRELNAVYAPLDARALLELLDAQGLHAALALPAPVLDEALGATAGLAPAAVWIARALLALLLAAGAWGCWRCVRPPAPSADERASGPAPPTPRSPPATSDAPVRAPLDVRLCRGPALVLLLLALLVVGLSALPTDALARTASALFKAGRPLDAENLEFIESLRTLGTKVAALLGLASTAACLGLPPWVRLARVRLPAAAWPALAIALPLLAVALLDLTGKRTLATRNLIGLAPAGAVLAALGLERLRASAPRAELAALALLAVIALPSLAALPAYGAKADWRGAAALVQSSGAEPIAAPPWVARCVEFHAGRPWNSVFGSRRAEDVAAWAAARERVVLVRQFDDFEDLAAIAAALAVRFGAPQVNVFRGGLRCEVYGPP